MKDSLDQMSVINLDSGTRLIVKDETEILIPKCLRKQMEDILHFSHSAAPSMITQCIGKIFWPSNTRHLRQHHILKSVKKISSLISSPARGSK